MATFNKFYAVGYLSKDAEVKTFNGGSSIVEFSFYTKEYQGKDKDLKTEFFDAESFLPNIVTLANNGSLVKGTQVYVEGRMSSSEYENKAGTKVRKWRVKVNDLKFLQPKGNGIGEGESQHQSAPPATNSNRSSRQTAPPPPPPQDGALDDDCPF